jgi:thioredoxin 1
MAGPGFATFDQANFDAQVLKRGGLTLVDFWSETCIPCKQMSRLLGELVNEVPAGVLIGKVNSDQNPELLARYGVRGVPALLFFKDGILVETRTGVDRKQVLKKAVEAHA